MGDDLEDLLEIGAGAIGAVVGFALPFSGPIIKVLTIVAGQCKNIKQSQDVCKSVFVRLKQLMDKMIEMEERKTMPAQETLVKYATVLQKFHDLLEKHLAKNAALRIASSGSLNEKIREIHEEIDMLFKMLNLAFVDEMMDWKRQYAYDQEQQQQQFNMMMSNFTAILSELRDQRAQQEAVTMLKFEAENRPERHTKEQLDMIKSTFRKIVSVSQIKVEAIPPWFLPPDEVDYDRKPFSQGSFGAAHRGTWGLGTRVVVKTLLVDTAGNDRAMKAFLREIDLWHQFNHPHVIKMYGACHVSSPPYIVCEDAVNGNLEDYLAKSANQNKTWRLLQQAALGLGYLHDRKVVHGDLKCNNILVGADGTARIADFGLSFVRSRSSSVSTKEQTGAVRWKAPECLRAMNPSLMSDVYSFGMVILEAVTGEPPWGMAADDDVRYAVVTEGRLPERPDDMSDRAWGLVQGMCHSEPKQRLPLFKVIEVLAELATEEANKDRGERVLCESCDFPNNNDVRFCGGCGKPLSKSESPARSTVTMSAPYERPSIVDDVSVDSRTGRASAPHFSSERPGIRDPVHREDHFLRPSYQPQHSSNKSAGNFLDLYAKRANRHSGERDDAGSKSNATSSTFFQSNLYGQTDAFDNNNEAIDLLPAQRDSTSFQSDLYSQTDESSNKNQTIDLFSAQRGRSSRSNPSALTGIANPFDVKRGRSSRSSLPTTNNCDYSVHHRESTSSVTSASYMQAPQEPQSTLVDVPSSDNATKQLLVTLRAGDPVSKQQARLRLQKKMRAIAIDIGATGQTTALMELLEHATEDEDKVIAAKLLGVIISLGQDVIESIVDENMIHTCVRVVSAPSTPVEARRRLATSLLGLPEGQLKKCIAENQVFERLVYALEREQDTAVLDHLTACVKHLTIGEPVVAQKLVRAGGIPPLLRLQSSGDGDSARYADSTLKFLAQTKIGHDAISLAKQRQYHSTGDLLRQSATAVPAAALRRQSTTSSIALSVPDTRRLIQALSGPRGSNSAYALLRSMREHPDSVAYIISCGGVAGLVAYLQQDKADLETATAALAVLAKYSPAEVSFIADSDAYDILAMLAKRGSSVLVKAYATDIINAVRRS